LLLVIIFIINLIVYYLFGAYEIQGKIQAELHFVLYCLLLNNALQSKDLSF